MKKLLVCLLVLLMLCATALSISAQWQSPFKDVKEGAWYYNAVKTTVEKGIFTGMSEDSFKPNNKMTRAMFVTTLAKMVNADVGEYTGTPFSDVKADAWYAKFVQWAYENKITSGMSADRFGVNDSITREQMVTLFYNTAAKYGADTSITDTYKFDKVYDDAKIRAYAVEAMKWAMQNSIISGTGVNGKEIIVDPWGTATRAQAAQIITKYLEFLDSDLAPMYGLTINGNPIENYRIIYASGVDTTKKAANLIKGYIKDACGVSLPVSDDSADVFAYEILVGRTNRETKGLVKADRDGKAVESFEISVQGNYVLVTGREDKYDSHIYGAYWFAKEVLEMSFYTEDVTDINVNRYKDVADGYEYKDGPGFETRDRYWSGGADEYASGSHLRGTGSVHNMGSLSETGGATDNDPCMSDPDIIATVCKNVKKKLDGRNRDTIWVSQNDSPQPCMCDNCKAIYREEGSRAGTLARLLNEVAAYIEADHPNVEIWTLAYEYTKGPVNTKLDDSIVVYYCPLDNCASHAYNDPSCLLNRSMKNHIEGWNEVCNKMYVWDYSTDFTFNLTAFPILTAMHQNKSWLYDMGVRGEFNNAVVGNSGEFGPLKNYMISELQWDPKIPLDEYNDKIDGFLEAYYGPGWSAIREYIDITEEITDENEFSYYVMPPSVMRDDQVIKYEEYFDALWDKAEALCENNTQLKRIRQSRISWDFMKLNGTYERDYTNGTAQSRAAYQQACTEFYETTQVYDVIWTERGKPVAFDTTKAPYKWVE